MTVSAGQRVLVTGGNRGIGLEVVKSVLHESKDHFVLLGCRNLEAGRALAAKLSEEHGERVEAIQLEATSAESIARAVELVGRETGHLDILVNNAGILLEADAAEYDHEAVRETMRVNFEGVIAVTEAFLPLLKKSPGGGQVLSTSSGVGTRTMAQLCEEHRSVLMDPGLDVPTCQKLLWQLTEGLQNPNDQYRSIPTVGYGLSKMGVNCYTQILARANPSMRINACSPGFCNTDMCANYTGERKPKDPALGASVFAQVLFGELGHGKTGAFFKEASKADTALADATSVEEPFVAAQGK
eukprot:gb/GFBE01076192.1/.p1 GENE.gb/GFBE01076192.1/~~gb/GFBE01076192.1/.p1  ORF type:complete len:299 (+),score=58.62 gb/GFBE01076192.1/:1-897(+)